MGFGFRLVLRGGRWGVGGMAGCPTRALACLLLVVVQAGRPRSARTLFGRVDKTLARSQHKPGSRASPLVADVARTDKRAGSSRSSLRRRLRSLTWRRLLLGRARLLHLAHERHGLEHARHPGGVARERMGKQGPETGEGWWFFGQRLRLRNARAYKRVLGWLVKQRANVRR